MSFLSNCTSGGCGAKIGAGELAEFLAKLKVKNDERLLVGFGARDDAAVYKINGETALVSTVDFFSPMVEDPFLFGKIAAANALSDVYAMGAKPLFALNLVCFPQKTDLGILREMLAGGAEKALEADTVIAGGHSIYDHEPKYGLAVTGSAHPEKILRNDTGNEGDALILTKPLGVGLIMCAGREGKAPPSAIESAAASMQRLNRSAAEKMCGFAVSACTDVTGFGLLVHAGEMAGERHTIVIESKKLPVIDGARSCVKGGFITSGGERNRKFMTGKCDISGVDGELQEVLFDPQTSGGLLIAVPEKDAAALCRAIRAGDSGASIIGHIVRREAHAVVVK
jgi:selenide,water dikinase